jgi:putative SOS response-associated peptidase YedK
MSGVRAHTSEASPTRDPREFERWLDPAVQEPKKLEPLLVPYSGDDLNAYPISTWVNSPRNNGPQCIERIDTVDKADAQNSN